MPFFRTLFSVQWISEVNFTAEALNVCGLFMIINKCLFWKINCKP